MMRWMIWLLPVVLVMAGCREASPEQLSLRAEKAYAAGEWPKAIAAYEQLLQRVGPNAMTHLNLALAAFRAQDLEYARMHTGKALELEPSGVTAERCRELQGMILEEEKVFAEAAKRYRGLLSAKDGDVRLRARNRLARLYANQDRHDSAFALLLAAANEQPMDATTCYNLGKLCYREQINLRRAALDMLRLAERLLPDGSRQQKDAANYVSRLEANLARLRQIPPAKGNATEAEKLLKQVADAKKKKRWKQAETLAEKATKADPSNFEAALELGRTCAKNSHHEAAMGAYDAALILRPNAVSAHAEAAQLAYKRKDYTRALAYLRPALVIEPRNKALADLMARILYAQRRPADARIWGEYYLQLAKPSATAGAAYRKWVESLPEE